LFLQGGGGGSLDLAGECSSGDSPANCARLADRFVRFRTVSPARAPELKEGSDFPLGSLVDRVNQRLA
jgi:hypothetical protein